MVAKLCSQSVLDTCVCSRAGAEVVGLCGPDPLAQDHRGPWAAGLTHRKQRAGVPGIDQLGNVQKTNRRVNSKVECLHCADNANTTTEVSEVIRGESLRVCMFLPNLA